MKKAKKEKVKLPMSLTKKLVLLILGVAGVALAAYLAFYFTYYVGYDRYRDFLSSYEYEQGTAYQTLTDAGNKVPGFDLVAENDKLKLYAQTATGNVAVYDKRDGSVTYTNPLNADEDEKANKNNKNYLKSQMMVYYYNEQVKSGNYDTYTQCVQKNQLAVESIENGVRFLYTVGNVPKSETDTGIYFVIPLEYRLDDNSLVVSVPASGIKEYNGYVYRIQLLRYMGAGHKSENGYIVVPNGSGSIINFNNGKLTSTAYSQYIYDIDPMMANYNTTENLDAARLPFFGICRDNRSLLVEVEEGATSAMITADISGKYNDYNFAYPIFILRNADNLKNFGTSTSDVYVLEEEIYDINATVRYTFLNDDYTGYAGLANYYREQLIAKGELTPKTASGNIPLYYDIIGGVKETAHTLGVQHIIASLAAYPLAKHNFPGKKILFQMVVLSMMFSWTVTQTPQYMIISWLRINNSYWALILPACAFGMGLYLMKQFMEQLPDSLMESARLDGASEFRIFWTIVMPNVKPAWLTLAIFQFQQMWSNTGGTFLRDEQLKPLQYALYQITAGGVARAGAGAAVTFIIAAVPITFFLICQSNVLETMTSSGMKE